MKATKSAPPAIGLRPALRHRRPRCQSRSGRYQICRHRHHWPSGGNSASGPMWRHAFRSKEALGVPIHNGQFDAPAKATMFSGPAPGRGEMRNASDRPRPAVTARREIRSTWAFPSLRCVFMGFSSASPPSSSLANRSASLVIAAAKAGPSIGSIRMPTGVNCWARSGAQDFENIRAGLVEDRLRRPRRRECRTRHRIEGRHAGFGKGGHIGQNRQPLRPVTASARNCPARIRSPPHGKEGKAKLGSPAQDRGIRLGSRDAGSFAAPRQQAAEHFPAQCRVELATPAEAYCNPGRIGHWPHRHQIRQRLGRRTGRNDQDGTARTRTLAIGAKSFTASKLIFLFTALMAT